MKRILVFGCGKYGERAALCFGDQVEAFVDNDVSKIGKEQCEKRVIGIDEAVALSSEYLLLIAIEKYNDVAEQLSKLGVDNYAIYIDDNDYLYKNIAKEDWDNKIVAILGVDNYTEVVIRYIRHFVSDNNIIIAEKDDSEHIGKSLMGFRVEPLSEYRNVDAIVVTPGNKQTELEYYCVRLGIKKECIVNTIFKRRWFENGFLIKEIYSDDNEEKDVLDYRRRAFDAEHVINKCVEEMEKSRPLFRKVEIETINRCNMNCPFCPVGISRDPREYAVMDEKLFYSIIDQLAEIEYSDRISLYSNNEPFLDDRIVEFQKYARKRLPNAFHCLVTNGTKLTIEKLENIAPMLDELVIDNYGKNRVLLDNISLINDYCEKHRELWEKVKIALRNPSQILTSRGGDSPNRTREVLYPNVKCTLPWFQLIIRPTGEISTCCADALGTRTMGDLRKQTILEAWYSKTFVDFRNALSNGRGTLDKCMYCDTFNLY